MTKGNGLPCKRCGTSEWNTCGACRECARIRTLEWYHANKGKVIASGKAWRENNREKSRETDKKWRKANPEKVKAKQKKHKTNNREKINEGNRAYRKKNRKRFNELELEYWRNNPERKAAISHRYRARKTQAGGGFTVQEWRELCTQYDSHCIYPGCERTDLHADHVIPVSKGGTSNIDNIQPLCGHHNQVKGGKHIDYRYKPGLSHWKQPSLFDTKGDNDG